MWGATNGEYVRLLPTRYEDGISIPAGFTTRPGARNISNEIMSSKPFTYGRAGLSAIKASWGQFIAHDVSLAMAASPAEHYDIIVPCCDPYWDPECSCNKKQEFLRVQYNRTRSGARMQTNSATAFVDASTVYASDTTRAQQIRTLSDGKLLSDQYGCPMNSLNLATDGPAASNTQRLTGDIRGNENPGLLALHCLFVLEHNRWCDVLARANPTWNDEKLYQEARLRVIAIIQVITWDEYVPALLGRTVPAYTGYKPSVNPAADLFFISVSYRYGHSAINSEFMRLGPDYRPLPSTGNMLLRDTYFKPAKYLDQGWEPLLRGLFAQPEQNIDMVYVDDVRNLFLNAQNDLASMDIHRAREYGLPSYNEARAYFNLSQATTWADVTSDYMLQQKLAQIYRNISALDPIVGGFAEDKLDGLTIGPLFYQSILEQFIRLRDGDRFWYTRTVPANELESIRTTTLADVVARNTRWTPPSPRLFSHGSSRPLAVPCSLSSSATSFSLVTLADGLKWYQLASGSYWLRYTIDRSLGRVDITVKVLASGWIGFGLGSSMRSADVVLMNYVSGTARAIDSYASSNVLPDADSALSAGSNDVTLVSATRADGYTTITFRRPLAATDAYDKSISLDVATEIIFAWGTDDTIAYHTNARRGLGQLIFATKSPFASSSAGSDPTTGAGKVTSDPVLFSETETEKTSPSQSSVHMFAASAARSPVPSSSFLTLSHASRLVSPTSGSSGQMTLLGFPPASATIPEGTTVVYVMPSASYNRERVFIVHGVVMGVLWGFFAPLAVLIVRYFKAHAFWVHAHRALMVLVVAGTLGGAAVGFARAGPNLPYSHNKLGISIVLVALVQFSLGALAKYMRENPEDPASVAARPWVGPAHRWLGRISLAISFANTQLGISKFSEQHSTSYSNWFGIVIGLWGAIFLVFEYRNNGFWPFHDRSAAAVAPEPGATAAEDAGDKKQKKTFSRQEFSKAVEEGAKYVLCDLLVVNVDDFIEAHPGGAHILREMIGKDIGPYFRGERSYTNGEHNKHGKFAQTLLQKMVIGELLEEDLDITQVAAPAVPVLETTAAQQAQTPEAPSSRRSSRSSASSDSSSKFGNKRLREISRGDAPSAPASSRAAQSQSSGGSGESKTRSTLTRDRSYDMENLWQLTAKTPVTMEVPRPVTRLRFQKSITEAFPTPNSGRQADEVAAGSRTWGDYVSVSSLEEPNMARPYTVVGIENERGAAGEVEIWVKRYERGAVSRRLCALSVDEESRAIIEGPFPGKIVERMLLGDVVLLAGGTGVLPFLDAIDWLTGSMWKQRAKALAAGQEPPVCPLESLPVINSRLTLFASFRSPADIIAGDFLEVTARMCPQRFRVIIHVQKPTAKWSGRTGYFTAEELKEAVTEQTERVLSCGPPHFSATVLKTLRSIGKQKIIML